MWAPAVQAPAGSTTSDEMSPLSAAPGPVSPPPTARTIAQARPSAHAAPPVWSPEDDEDYLDSTDLVTAPAPASVIATAIARAPGSGSGAQDTRPRSLDEAVLSVLREEANREVRARRAEPDLPPAPTVETAGPEATPDLGSLDAAVADQGPVAALRPPAREIVRTKPPFKVDENWNVIEPGSAADQETATAMPAAVARQSRRDLLPDIDTIKTSIGEASERSRPDPEEPIILGPGRRRQKRGFRFSFSLVLLLGLALLMLYGLAPRLAAQVPALDLALKLYVSLIDQARVLVDTWMRQLLTMLEERSAA